MAAPDKGRNKEGESENEVGCVPQLLMRVGNCSA